MDMTLCPLCSQPNNCAMEIEKSTGQKQEPCWCVSVEFPKELLAQLPRDAAGCICNQCVSNAIPITFESRLWMTYDETFAENP